MTVRRQVHQGGLGQAHQRARRGIKQDHRQHQREIILTAGDHQHANQKTDAAAQHQHPAPPYIAQNANDRLEQQVRYQSGQGQQQADLLIAQAQLCPDQRQGGFLCPKNKFVQVLDHEQHKDDHRQPAYPARGKRSKFHDVVPLGDLDNKNAGNQKQPSTHAGCGLVHCSVVAVRVSCRYGTAAALCVYRCFP